MNAGEQFCTECCGLCAIACTGAFQSWCFTKSWCSGARSGSRQAGCCGSCCNKSFDEDDFEPQAQSGAADAGGANATGEQPAPQTAMSEKPAPADS